MLLPKSVSKAKRGLEEGRQEGRREPPKQQVLQCHQMPEMEHRKEVVAGGRCYGGSRSLPSSSTQACYVQ